MKDIQGLRNLFKDYCGLLYGTTYRLYTMLPKGYVSDLWAM